MLKFLPEVSLLYFIMRKQKKCVSDIGKSYQKSNEKTSLVNLHNFAHRMGSFFERKAFYHFEVSVSGPTKTLPYASLHFYLCCL